MTDIELGTLCTLSLIFTSLQNNYFYIHITFHIKKLRLINNECISPNSLATCSNGTGTLVYLSPESRVSS